MTTFTITPRGPFSLAAAERFYGRWEATAGVRARPGELLRIAFLVDDWRGAAGLVVRQDAADGPVEAELLATQGDVDPSRVEAQLTRVLSLDHDGTGYPAVGERDEVVGELLRAGGHQRPVLYHSPYEAACWAIIIARIHSVQARRIRLTVSEALDVDGVDLGVFPSPEALLRRDHIDGLSDEKVACLHDVARAALAGELDRDRLLALEPGEALQRLQRLRGMTALGAARILLRGVGPTDALTTVEPRMRHAAAIAYRRPELLTDDAAFTALAEPWRPYRTWVSVLLRSSAPEPPDSA